MFLREAIPFERSFQSVWEKLPKLLKEIVLFLILDLLFFTFSNLPLQKHESCYFKVACIFQYMLTSHTIISCFTNPSEIINSCFIWLRNFASCHLSNPIIKRNPFGCLLTHSKLWQFVNLKIFPFFFHISCNSPGDAFCSELHCRHPGVRISPSIIILIVSFGATRIF